MRTAFTALAFTIGFSSMALADDVIGGGNLFAHAPRDHIVCQFFNAGATPVRIINPQILDQFGTPFALFVNQCDDTETLVGGRSCGIRVNNTEARSWSCRARISPNKQNVRGVLDIRKADQTVIVNTELR